MASPRCAASLQSLLMSLGALWPHYPRSFTVLAVLLHFTASLALRPLCALGLYTRGLTDLITYALAGPLHFMASLNFEASLL
ncbi:hypothetical protein N7509_000723 [Penicillium cosmopolitanum]|uniref:Uncharacterized protein n=1 Tax=Penicillium cosmopolitanum TaxID=1131564 RepID=A0A9W9WAU3_9EURO|nr:uncharacterized protein N7509_000723 [Penicillium cosmopolitanum]KAJ5414096.1 hypothetical protein N7509_000723 [Penicillium cosmopolitanum]